MKTPDISTAIDAMRGAARLAAERSCVSHVGYERAAALAAIDTVVTEFVREIALHLPVNEPAPGRITDQAGEAARGRTSTEYEIVQTGATQPTTPPPAPQASDTPPTPPQAGTGHIWTTPDFATSQAILDHFGLGYLDDVVHVTYEQHTDGVPMLTVSRCILTDDGDAHELEQVLKGIHMTARPL